MILDGNAIPVKQCMPEGMEINVETVDFDNEEQTSSSFRAKRFLGIFTVNQHPDPLYSPPRGGKGSSRNRLSHSGGPPLTGGNTIDNKTETFLNEKKKLKSFHEKAKLYK